VYRLNTAAWLAVIAVHNNKYDPDCTAETIGFNFWFVVDFVLLLNANRLKRKMKMKAEQDELDSFLRDKTISNTDNVQK